MSSWGRDSCEMLHGDVWTAVQSPTFVSFCHDMYKSCPYWIAMSTVFGVVPVFRQSDRGSAAVVLASIDTNPLTYDNTGTVIDE